MANISTEGTQEHLKAGKVFHWSRWIVSWEIQLFLQILVEDQVKFASYLHVNQEWQACYYFLLITYYK